jgi:hypothetical protein
MAVTTHSRNSAPFTISEESSDELPETTLVARTKRYTFYWLVGEEPILLTVKDVDGTTVTGEIEPPDRMVEQLAQAG